VIPHHLNELTNFIYQTENLTSAEKSKISEYIQKVKAESENNLFKYTQAEKDRKLVISYLKDTIGDLEINHQQLEEANSLLTEQNQIIDRHLKKLVDAYQELEQFTYIASHDLKAPLRTIGSYSQLIKTKYEDQLDEKAIQYLNLISSSMTQLTKVIDDSLKFSNIGKQSLNHNTIVSLNKILSIVKENLKEEISKSGAVIHYHDLPEVHGRQSTYILLFENLIQNSIKFCSSSDPTLYISSRTYDDITEIKLVDNGRGIDQKYWTKIFNPFQKIDAQHLDGTGIGLAICKKIVALYGGDISCQSEIGKGSTFTFTLSDKINV